jgi:hypothetical protein
MQSRKKLLRLLVGGVKANLSALRLWLWRWIKNIHDALEDFHNGRLVEVEAAFEFLLQLRQLAGKLPGVRKRGPHLEEGAHNIYAHLHGLRTVQNVGGHDGAVFGEGVRQVFAVLSASGF